MRGALEAGLLLLALPVGAEALIWNAHRVYGRRRWATLSLSLSLPITLSSLVRGTPKTWLALLLLLLLLILLLLLFLLVL